MWPWSEDIKWQNQCSKPKLNKKDLPRRDKTWPHPWRIWLVQVSYWMQNKRMGWKAEDGGGRAFLEGEQHVQNAILHLGMDGAGKQGQERRQCQAMACPVLRNWSSTLHVTGSLRLFKGKWVSSVGNSTPAAWRKRQSTQSRELEEGLDKTVGKTSGRVQSGSGGKVCGTLEMSECGGEGDRLPGFQPEKHKAETVVKCSVPSRMLLSM